MRSVLVANPKGGAGKTTLSTNLAGYFANQGHAVTLCDLDRQQSSLRWMAFRSSELAPVQGAFAGNQMTATLPQDADWVVLDAPAGFQGYKLNDYLRTVTKVLIPIVPSIFDMAATEDFLNAVRQDTFGRRPEIGIVAMRVDPRTRAAHMLEEFLKHFHMPIVAYLRNTQNYVNAASEGATIFDPPRARNRKDVEQWQQLIKWVSN